MAMTYATISGKITRPGSNIGIRARVTATPMTTASVLEFPDEDRITWGPETAETDNIGVLSTLKIPLNHGMPELYWRIVVEPIDRIPGVSKWTVGTFPITASARLEDLVEIDTIAVNAEILVSLTDLVSDAENARDDAEAAALEAQESLATMGTSASDAAASATAAAGSASSAATSASAASGSASTATTKAGDAAASATAAATSATAAQTARTGAETAQTGVTEARDAAVGARTGAETARDAAAASAQAAANSAAEAAAGGVQKVNGESPDTNGNITIDAADVGAASTVPNPVAGRLAQIDAAGQLQNSPLDAATVGTQIADLYGGLDNKLDASAAPSLRDRATHTGTQTSATISDFTEAAQDAVAALLTSGTNVTLTYNDAGNALQITAAGADAETMRDTIGAALVGVGNVTVTVNDAGDTITIATTATANSTDAQLRDRSTHTGTQPASTISDFQSSAQTVGDARYTRKTLGGAELSTALSATTGTATGDLSAASIFTVTPTGAITLAFSNVPASGTACTVTVIVTQGATAYAVTPPSGTKWMGAAAPTQVASKTCVFTFLTTNGGTTWYASAAVEQ